MEKKPLGPEVKVEVSEIIIDYGLDTLPDYQSVQITVWLTLRCPVIRNPEVVVVCQSETFIDAEEIAYAAADAKTRTT